MSSSELIWIDDSAPARGSSWWADWAGIVASIGCAIHCAAMPLVLAYLPAFGLSWLADEGFHQWMAMICFVLAAIAFAPGWWRHRSLVPAGVGLLGLALITGTAFFATDVCCAAGCHTAYCAETMAVATPALSRQIIPWLTPLGGLLLVTGHLVNHRLSCGCCHGEEACNAA